MRTIGNDQSKTRETQAVASGALPSGKAVVVNSDGTVSVITESSATETLGAGGTFNSDGGANPKEMSILYDSNSDRVIVAYKSAGYSNYGYAVVGTVSGTTISYGTPVQFAAGWTEEPSMAFDSTNNKVVIAFRDRSNSFYGTAIVGTVSGTSISFGTEVVYTSNNVSANPKGTSYDTANQKIVIAFRNNSVSNRGQAVVGTVSGNSISFGSAVNFSTQRSRQIAISYNSTEQKHLICWCNQDQNERIQAVAGTVSGTSISFGSVSDGNSTPVTYIDADYSSTHNKHVVVYHDQNAGGDGIVRVVTMSGSSISWGGSATFETGSTVYNSVAYSDVSNSFVTFCIDDTNNAYPTLNTGTISGTTPSVGTPQTTGNIAQSLYTDVTATKDGKFVICNQSGSTGTGASRVFQAGYTATNLTSDNYIGISGGINVQTGSAGSTGSTNTFNSRTTSEIYGAYDANSNRVVIAYRDNGNGDNGTAIVGSISGTTITFGSPEIYHANLAQDNTVVFDSANNKVVISFIAWDNSNNRYGTSVVATVSGTSISFGTPVQFNGTQTTEIGSCFDSNSNKVVVAYRDNSNSNYGTARVGTVSGTSISFGTEVVYESASAADNSIVFDSNSNKVVVAYSDGGNSLNGTAVVGTVSGTSISFGTPVVWDGGVSATHITTSFDTNSNKVVIAYVDTSDNDIPKAIVGTVSGTSISFGTPTAYSTGTGDRQSMVYDVSANRHVIFFSDEGDSFKGKTVSGLVSGTSISFTEKALLADGSTQHLSAVYDPDDGKVILSFDNVSNNYGVSAVHTADTISTTTAEVADGGNAVINVKGNVSNNLIGLTSGQSYYVQTDGTLSTTADDPSVFAGTAVSSTKLIVKG